MSTEPISKSNNLTVSPYIKRERASALELCEAIEEEKDDIIIPNPISRYRTIAPIGTTSNTGTQTELTPEEASLDPIIIGGSSMTTILQGGSGSVISILVQKNAELERKLNGLMDYLENWIDVGTLNMNDIKQYIESYSQ